MVSAFEHCCRFDPLIKFFKDPTKAFPNADRMRPVDLMHHFRAPRQFTFDTWQDYSPVMGIGMVMDHAFQNRCKELYGDAGFIPTAGTWNSHYGTWLAYMCVVSVILRKNQPAIVPGDRVRVSRVNGKGNVATTDYLVSEVKDISYDRLRIMLNRP
jgi:hypothetical protein